MGRFYKILTIVISFLIIVFNISLAEEGYQPHAEKVYPSTSNSTIFSSDKGEGLRASSVNLYTAQHTESFPLVSISGRGGIGATLSLEYNGNVSHIAKEENRKAQTSIIMNDIISVSNNIVSFINQSSDIFSKSFKGSSTYSSSASTILYDSPHFLSPVIIYSNIYIYILNILVAYTIFEVDLSSRPYNIKILFSDINDDPYVIFTLQNLMITDENLDRIIASEWHNEWITSFG